MEWSKGTVIGVAACVLEQKGTPTSVSVKLPIGVVNGWVRRLVEAVVNGAMSTTSCGIHNKSFFNHQLDVFRRMPFPPCSF